MRTAAHSSAGQQITQWQKTSNLFWRKQGSDRQLLRTIASLQELANIVLSPCTVCRFATKLFQPCFDTEYLHRLNMQLSGQPNTSNANIAKSTAWSATSHHPLSELKSYLTLLSACICSLVDARQSRLFDLSITNENHCKAIQ